MGKTIGTLLLFVCLVQASTAVPVDRLKRHTFELNVAKYNIVRQYFGGKSGISYPELVWDSSLRSKAVDISRRDCDETRTSGSTRWFLTEPDEAGRQAVEFYGRLLLGLFGKAELPPILASTGIAEEIEENVNDPDFSFFEYEILNPAQTKIGCAKRTCTGTFGGSQKLKFDVICVLGSTNRFDNYKEIAQKYPV